MSDQFKPADSSAILLGQELTRRRSKNPRYSQRAFASSLGISHSLLSMILTNQRNVSRKTKKKIEDQIKLLTANEEHNKFHTIDAQKFFFFSEWYHYAILSLLELPDSSLDPVWIGARLGIDPNEAAIAIARLKKSELIRPRRGKWKQATQPIFVSNTAPHHSIIEHHQQILQKAQESLETVPFEQREITAITFAMNSKAIDYAREEIQKFRRKLSQELETMGTPDAVYELSVQLFPLTKKDDEK